MAKKARKNKPAAPQYIYVMLGPAGNFVFAGTNLTETQEFCKQLPLLTDYLDIYKLPANKFISDWSNAVFSSGQACRKNEIVDRYDPDPQ